MIVLLVVSGMLHSDPGDREVTMRLSHRWGVWPHSYDNDLVSYNTSSLSLDRNLSSVFSPCPAMPSLVLAVVGSVGENWPSASWQRSDLIPSCHPRLLRASYWVPIIPWVITQTTILHVLKKTKKKKRSTHIFLDVLQEGIFQLFTEFLQAALYWQ